MRQKAQVPLLIIALAVVLLVYTYFMPLSEKCKLINLPECSQLVGPVYSISPGTLEVKENKVEYSIPDIDLFTVGSTETNDLAESITVKKGWFYSYSPKLTFNSHEQSKNVNLYIYLTENKKVNVRVNGNNLAVLESAGQNVIPVPSDKLKPVNVLEIYPSAPFFFWNVNSVNIGKVISEESYVVTQEKVTQTIDIKEDLKDINTATLLFRSGCFNKNNNLSITMNNTEISNNLTCGNFESDVTRNLKQSNNITFFSKGNYFLYSIRLSLELKQSSWPTYYFNLIEKKKADFLSIQFSDKSQKSLTVYINEKSFAIETSEMSWSTDITDYLKVGQNKIVLMPGKTVNITNLEVY